jgi:hypothetical protein
MARPVAEPEVHLIPEGFVGHVVLRHGVAGGVPLERDGGARVYRIPAGGVLETAAPANHGIREPGKIAFYYDGAERRALRVHRTDAPVPDDEIAILGGYQVSSDFHYFVDRPRNAGRYRNPALQDGEREPEPSARAEAFLRYALYPIATSQQPSADVDRAERLLLAGVQEQGDAIAREHLRAMLDVLRAELAHPSHRLAAMRGPEAQSAPEVSEAELLAYVRLLADRIDAALAALAGA